MDIYYKKAEKRILKTCLRGSLEPRGVTIHYTADINTGSIIRSLQEKGLAYHFLITVGGGLIQLAELDRCVWHAGHADWNGLSPNQYHIAIAFESWGLLTKRSNCFFSWCGIEVNKKEVIEKEKRFWHKINFAQLMTLFDICFWLCDNGISSENFCGHDECALPLGRKIDPGGSLVISMDTLRSILFQRTISV